MQDGLELYSFGTAEEPIFQALFHPHESTLILRATSGIVRAWSLSGGQLQLLYEKRDDQYSEVAYSVNEELIALGSRDGSIVIGNSQDGGELQRLIGHSKDIAHLAFSPDDTMLVSSSYDTTCRVWQITGEGKVVFEDHPDSVICARFTQDQQFIFSYSVDYDRCVTGDPPGGLGLLWNIDSNQAHENL